MAPVVDSVGKISAGALQGKALKSISRQKTVYKQGFCITRACFLCQLDAVRADMQSFTKQHSPCHQLRRNAGHVQTLARILPLNLHQTEQGEEQSV